MKGIKRNVLLGTEVKEIHGETVEVTVYKEFLKPTYNRDKVLGQIMGADPETVQSILKDIETIEEAASHFEEAPIQHRPAEPFIVDGDMLSCSEYMELEYEGDLH